MERRTKARMVIVGLLAAAMASLLWCCDETPPRSAGTVPPLVSTRPAASAPARASTAPRPVVLSKPPMLGPVGPAIVILPEEIAQPDIRVRLTAPREAPPVIQAGKYRGRIETLKLSDGKYVALNILPLDSYLQGVLTRELLASWNPETFRAQAIAARTFALFQIVTDGRTKQWDVTADETSQVYGGISAETAASRAAVAATRGQVLMANFNGKTGIFCSFYSSCIGGASQDPFDAWGDPSVGPLAAHLTGEVDTNSARFNWDRDFAIPLADVTRCVHNWGDRNSFAHLQALGNIASVAISKRNPVTNRPTELLLTDAAGRTAPIRAEEFRIALKNDPLARVTPPYSSNCDIRMEGGAVVLYNGHGFGHGIGMSQWGAQNLARQGRSYAEILAFFYPGASIRQIW